MIKDNGFCDDLNMAAGLPDGKAGRTDCDIVSHGHLQRGVLRQNVSETPVDGYFGDDSRYSEDEYEINGSAEEDVRMSEARKSNTPALDNFGTDMTQMAREGKLGPVVGRD